VAEVARFIAEAVRSNLFVQFLAALIAAAMAVVTLLPVPAHAQIPDAARRYKHDYTRIVRSEWGLAAPVATLAGQIGQESQWDCRAVSRVGARGCAQFMPATGLWIGDVDRSLKAGDLHSPQWAFRAQAVYMKWLHARIKASDKCELMAFALQSYNSGLGWVYKRQKLSRDPDRCLGATCLINPGVLPGNQKEAQEYPERILLRHAPMYMRAGWGPTSC
jgi:soluble lytic murein transglycosylase-like protein